MASEPSRMPTRDSERIVTALIWSQALASWLLGWLVGRLGRLSRPCGVSIGLLYKLLRLSWSWDSSFNFVSKVNRKHFRDRSEKAVTWQVVNQISADFWLILYWTLVRKGSRCEPKYEKNLCVVRRRVVLIRTWYVKVESSQKQIERGQNKSLLFGIWYSWWELRIWGKIIFFTYHNSKAEA